MSESPIISLLQELGAAEVPVSFYDAVMVVQSARRRGELDEQELSALIALHDSPVSTDGARAVLKDYLSSCAQRMAAERERASRTLTMKDHGKVARARVGSSLVVALDERSGTGFRWEAERISGGAEVTRLASSRGTAKIEVRITGPGRAHIWLVEQPPPATGARPDTSRRFELYLVCEPR